MEFPWLHFLVFVKNVQNPMLTWNLSALEILQTIQKSAEWLIYSLLLRNPVILFHNWNFHVILTRVTHWA